MLELTENIKRINDKLQKLMKQYTQLQKDNVRQSALIANLQETKTKNNQSILQLQEQVHILKTSAGLMNEPEKKVFEKHINQYIKEIDKCISFLSK